MVATSQPHTTAAFLRHWAAARPDHVALRWSEGQMTYAELDRRTNRVAQALAAEGIGPADRVTYLGKNSPEQAELLLGAAKLNAVPCPVNYRLAPDEVAYIVADAASKVFVVDAEFTSVVEAVKVMVPDLRVVVMGFSSQINQSYAAWRDAQPDLDPNVAQAEADVGCQLYTSGTTGRPKGVQLTQSNLVTAFSSVYLDVVGLAPNSTSLLAVPMYHIAGAGWLLAGIMTGATNVVVRDVVASELARALASEKITETFLVPAILQRLLAVPDIGGHDFSALRSIVYGSSPIAEKVLVDSLTAFGCGFYQVYGMTETTGPVACLRAADHDISQPQRLRALGRPVPPAAMKVVNPTTGEPAPVGEVGELCVSGPSVMLGYWRQPEQTNGTVGAHGWLRTGDAGYQDDEGYFYVQDRFKDMIVSGGENVYPAEVENALMSHPFVVDVAVIGVPSERWGETPVALVVGVNDVTEQELLAHCRSLLAGFKCPSRIEWRSDLPRNPSGKILKRELREPYWQGRTRMVS